MLMLAAANPAPVVAREPTDALFTEDERCTAAAELHLVPLDQPCPDHQACRRFSLRRAARRRAPRRESPTVSADSRWVPGATLDGSRVHAGGYPSHGRADFSPGQPQRLPTRSSFPCRSSRAFSAGARLAPADPSVAVAGSRYLPPHRPGPACPARRLLPSPMPGVWRQHLFPDEVEAVPGLSAVQWEDERPRRGRPPK